MRSADQIGSTVEQWHELQRTQRAATLAALLNDLEKARLEDAEWYRWITDGQPRLSPERYAEVGLFKKAKKSQARVDG